MRSIPIDSDRLNQTRPPPPTTDRLRPIIDLRNRIDL
jgi:hypothetical protein